MSAGDGSARYRDMLAAGAGVSAALFGLCHVFPRLRVETEMLALRLRYATLSCEGGTYGETQREVGVVLGLERKRRLAANTSIETDMHRHVLDTVHDVHTGSVCVDSPDPSPSYRGKRKRLVLVGGGHAHVHAVKSLRKHPLQHAEVVLVSRGVNTPYSGMLPAYIAGQCQYADCHVDLGRLCDEAGVRFVVGEVMHIDAERSCVKYRLNTASQPNSPKASSDRIPQRGDSLIELTYDVLSVDIGSQPRGFFGSHGDQERHVTPVKPIDLLDARWRRVMAAAHDRVCVKKERYTLAVVGSGAAGCELALAADARLKRDIGVEGDAGLVQVVLIGRAPVPLSGDCPAARRVVAEALRARGIPYHGGVTITSPVPAGLRGKTQSGAQLEFPCSEALWCTEAGTALWLSNTTLTLDHCGFVRVKDTLQSLSHPNVFAAGDCASLPMQLPKAGVVAVAQGPLLTNNLRAYMRSIQDKCANYTPIAFTPPRTPLLLVGLGDSTAVAARGCLALHAPWVWQLKQWIDRSWIADYQV